MNMSLIGLAEAVGCSTKKTSSAAGGEWHGPCPACGGKDRFIIQPHWQGKGRYLCRRCGRKGDTIKFCMEFMGCNFNEACNKAGKPQLMAQVGDPVRNQTFAPSQSWNKRAEVFVESANERLLKDSVVLRQISKSRGLTQYSIRRFRIGFNPVDAFPMRADWGLNGDIGSSKLCLPRGIVIPSYHQGQVSAIKIRRYDWKEGDRWPKYNQIPGSSNVMPFFGYLANQVAILVESEFDAMFLLQEIGEFCTSIALGGAGKKPDAFTSEWLDQRKLILYALDTDEAGRVQYDWWRKAFPQLRAWPANTRKSPADSFLLDGINPSQWFEEGRRYWESKL